MSFLPLESAWDLACLVQFHDATCQHDLANGLITSERDYVSNLATHLRYPSGSIMDSRIMSIPGLQKPKYQGKIKSFTLPTSTEQILGFDGAIVISRPGAKPGEILHKIGLFEAKWPRAFGGHPSLGAPHAINRDDWDSARRVRGVQESHFSRQLITQSALNDAGIVLWEQFFSELPVGNNGNSQFKKIGSTCVLHQDALAYMRDQDDLNPDNHTVRNAPWKWRHLEEMFSQAPALSLRYLIFLMAGCFLGKPLPGSNAEVRVALPNSNANQPTSDGASNNVVLNPRLTNILVDNRLVFSLPTDAPDSTVAVHKTMRQLGLQSYTHFLFDEDAYETAVLNAARLVKLKALVE